MKAVILITLLSIASMALSRRVPISHTPLGKLRGYEMTSRGGRTFLAFSAVPFARPPVGDLAFEPPQPAEPWVGVRDATKEGPSCIQYNFYVLNATVEGVQDCLYLSVFTHNLNGKAPVLVHIYGGGFTSGSGQNVSMPDYFMDEDVVIVNINYRVGIFGFLSFEDHDMPGNQGLKDQVMALRWVQQNIASFGGDPSKVTLVGESAGAASVYHHTLSPLSKGLFRSAIAESGSSYAIWAFAPPGFTRGLAIQLLTFLGGTYTTTKEAVDFIKKKDPREVASQLRKYRKWDTDTVFNFGPVPEPAGPGAFLSGPVSQWKHNPVPLFIGTTSGEGLLWTTYFNYTNMSYKWLSENFEEIAPRSLLYLSSASKPDEVTKVVRDYYLPGREITEADWVNISKMYGDVWTDVPTLDGANKHTGDVYFYHFDYIGEYLQTELGSVATNRSVFYGANHVEEVNYLWRYSTPSELKGKDLELSKRLVRVWTDFAKHGTPSPKGCGIDWPKWTKEHHRYIHITQNAEFKVKEGLVEERYRFWNSVNYRDKYNHFIVGSN